MSSTTTLTPFSLRKRTMCPPMPPAPPVTSTISLPRQSYWSLVQLLRTRAEYQLLSQRARPRRKSTRSRARAAACRMDRFWPRRVRRAARRSGRVTSGFSAVLEKRRTTVSILKPSRGSRPLCIGMVKTGEGRQVLWRGERKTLAVRKGKSLAILIITIIIIITNTAERRCVWWSGREDWERCLGGCG